MELETRTHAAVACLCLVVLVAIPAPGQDDAFEGFETWDEAEASNPSEKTGSPDVRQARMASRTGQVDRAPAERAPAAQPAPAAGSLEQQAAAESPESSFAVRFGAGASWLVGLRVADRASADHWLSDFSLSWAPFGLVGEIGVDLSLGRDSLVLFRPNLKFFFVKEAAFSLYLKGGCALLSHEAGLEVGGGGGLGLVFGIIDNLALEIEASAAVYSLSDTAAAALLDLPDEPQPGVEPPSGLTVFPAVTARLVARF